MTTLRLGCVLAFSVFLLPGCPAEEARGSPVVEGSNRSPDVVYVPTPQPVVERMLELARVGPGDVVYDLGCGDGRVAVAAALRGARSVCVDIDPARIEESRENVRRAGVGGRVRIVQGDLFELDFRDATVVSLYLLPSLNVKLRPQLFEQLRPGTRVVSHDFDMGDWEADRTVEVEGPGRMHTVYHWVIPGQVEGRWALRAEGAEAPETGTLTQRVPPVGEPPVAEDGTLTERMPPVEGAPAAEEFLELQQTYQRVQGTLTSAGRTLQLEDVRLEGDVLTFMVGGNQPRQFRARIGGDRMVVEEAGAGRLMGRRMTAPGA